VLVPVAGVSLWLPLHNCTSVVGGGFVLLQFHCGAGASCAACSLAIFSSV